MRYAKYKPTNIPWLPEVPEGWECCRIKQVLIANDGGVWGSDPLDESDTIVLRSTEQDVDGTLKVVSPARRHLSESEICKALLKEGDLIITKSSGSAEHIGKTSLIDKATADLQCCYSNFLQRLRVNGEAKFYWYLFNSRITKKQFDFLCTTTTGLKNLNARIIGNIIFPLPPLAEQRAIVAFLDGKCGKIDRWVAAKEREVALLKELKQAMIAEAVTGATNIASPTTARKMKPSGIPWLPEIPEGWEVRRARYLFKRVQRPVREGDEIVTCFRDGQVTLRKNRRTSGFTEATDYSHYQGIRKGDLVIHQMDAFAGACGVSDADGMGTPVLSICRAVDAQYCAEYFAYVVRLMGWNKFIQSLARGIRERSTDFRYETFAKQVLPVPPLAEQRAIVAYLEARAAKIDAAVAGLEREVAAMKEYKQRLIAEVVTGQRRVV